jgi:hypothetical protein
MIDRLQVRSTWILQISQDGETDTPTPALRPEAVNGSAYEVH